MTSKPDPLKTLVKLGVWFFPTHLYKRNSNMEKLLKNPLSVRGDSLYCPLAFSLDSYWNCLCDCLHCYLRRMNETWGKELRPADIEEVNKRLTNGPQNHNPKTPLAWCLKNKKTIRWGNKSDPFQPAEAEHRVSRSLFKLLIKHNWTFVIQTMCTDILEEYEKYIYQAHEKRLITIMPVVSPGLDRDWQELERKATTKPLHRLLFLQKLIKNGVPGGVNGEPFIPGYHTIDDFEDTLKLLKSLGINRYNTYNFHFNAFVAKRLHAHGIDIERIWYMNQDSQWRPILQQLLDLSKKYNIILGCPDFVNSGPDWIECANTCCGIDVPNPCTWNTHYFKKFAQNGQEITSDLYDGTGSQEQGMKIIEGKPGDFYTLKDAGVV